MIRAGSRAVYAFLHAKGTGLSLILQMGGYALIGTVVAQAPDDVREDPQAYAAWLDSVRPRYGWWTTPMEWAGYFHAFSSVGFLVVSALLAASIVACTAHRVPVLWQRARHPHVQVGDATFEHAALRARLALAVPPERALEQVRVALAARRFRVLDDPGPADPAGAGVRSIYADRFRYFPLFTLVSHASFVLIIAGVGITAVAGFRDQQVPVTVGARTEVGHHTGLQVQARSFHDAYYPDGRPKDFASDLVLYQDGKQVAEATVRVNQPLRWDGLSFYQASFGTSAVVDVTDATGRVVHDSGVPLRWTLDGQSKAMGMILLPTQGLVAYVVTSASGHVNADLRPGEARIFLTGAAGGGQLATQLLSPGQSATLGGLTFTFRGERQFTGLTISRDPGAAWVWTGAVLMLIGLFATLYFRHRFLWVRIVPTPGGCEVSFAATERRDRAFEAWFHRFVAAATAGLEAATETTRGAADPASCAGLTAGSADGDSTTHSEQTGLIHA